MNIHFAPEHHERRVRIKVVGVGGAGGNAVNRMVEAGLGEVDFYAVNTDGQALDTSRAHQTLVIGADLTREQGAGGDPTLGRAAAESDRELLTGIVGDADMVFVTAGMGGGTGTGAAPVVAEVARQSGALTVAVVTRPFMFEGRRRAQQADQGLAALREHVDALLVIPNERLMEIEVADVGMTEVFRVADNVLYEATRGISDIISRHAVVNLDFADVRTVMKDSGAAIMGTGRGTGDDRAVKAAETAINSPLLEDVNIQGSRAVLVYLSAGSVTRNDLSGAMNLVQDAAGQDAHVFFGFGNDESLGDDLQVTVIATGFPSGIEDAVPASTVSTAVAQATPTEPAEPEAPEAPETLAPEAALVSEPEIDLEPEPEPEPEVESVLEPEPAPAVAMAPTPVAEAMPEPGPLVEPPLEVEPPAALEFPEVAPPPMDEPLMFAPESPEDPRVTLVPDPVPEPAPEPAVILERPADTARLAEMAAAAGQSVTMVPETPAVLETPTPMESSATVETPSPVEISASETSQRFLEPMGTVKLSGEEQNTTATETNQRFRHSVLSHDKSRPAWERKYVD